MLWKRAYQGEGILDGIRQYGGDTLEDKAVNGSRSSYGLRDTRPLKNRLHLEQDIGVQLSECDSGRVIGVA